MIDFTDLIHQAERELVSSETLLRATKTGILFGIIAASVRKYSSIPVSNSDILRLVEVLVRDGHLLDTLTLSEARTLSEKTVHPSAYAEAPVTPPAVSASIPPLSEAERREREEDVRVMKAKGYSAEEIEAILSIKDAAAAGSEVLYRTDEDLARYEEDKNNPFPGTPQGFPLNGFTMTGSEPLPPDLKTP